MSASQGEGAFGTTLGQSTVQLRGLPLGTTLVLVNGRRMESVGSSSADFFDFSLIPLAAIDRVEIVPVGSSAVYGGDALAGVVNIILKKSLEGPSLSVGAGGGKGAGDASVSLATGGTSGDSSYLLLGAYSRSTPLYMSERAFFRDADYRRFGGPDARSRNCTPGTVSSTSGANLPGLGSSLAGIPVLAAGQAPQVSDFQATAGRPNLCSSWTNGNGYALVQGKETYGIHASAERHLAGSWEVFGELTLTKERVWADQLGLALSNVLVPAGNPFNPFGEDVRVTTVLGPENGLQGFERNSRYSRVLAGLRGELTANWDAEVTLSSTRDNGKGLSSNATLNSTARDAALASSSAAQALDPFATGRAASDDVLRGIWTDSLRTSRGTKEQVSAFVRGHALELPAGPLDVIVGGEYARDVYATTVPGSVNVDASRAADAAFGEVRAPLWRGQGFGKPWDLAVLTLAGRRDHYNDFGSAGTYQAGLEVRPTRELLLRGSAASSFKPPTLLETHVDASGFPSALFGLTDPARGNEAIDTAEVERIGNPNLKPERGRAYSLGGLWEPASSPGTRIGATAWRVKIDGLISILFPQTALDYESLFPGFVERGPSVGGQPGPVTKVLFSETNFGGIDTSGVDLEAAHSWTDAFGKWSLGASATKTTRYNVVLAPGVPTDDRLGRRFSDYWSPRWKGRLTAGLEHETWSVAITSRYLGSYLDSGTSDSRLGDYWTHDLAASVDLKRLGIGWAPGIRKASLSAGIANLFNRQPQFVNTAPYFDVTQADWRGRYASVRLSIDW